jgi:hypothetical protein
MTAVISTVDTPIHECAGELFLPAGSYYQGLRDHVDGA